MKIYHLADLHFGKSIYGLSMIDDQRYWSEQFLAYCRKERPDAVLIAGDVYDRSAPSAEAVSLLDHFLTALAEDRIPVLMIAGNHDSGQRLSFGSTILARENIHIAGTVKKELEHVTFEDPDGYGPVTVWLLPYTYPEEISAILEAEDIHTYDSAIRRIIEAQEIDPARRNVILSHQNVVCQGKEAERGGSETMVGGVGQIEYTAYDAFEYAALGHIHSSYPVGREEVRYAGTPLCYHLEETRQKDKGFTEVILYAKGEKPEIRRVSFPPRHPMYYYTGTKAEIYRVLNEHAGRNELVGVTLTDERVTPEIHAYIKQLVNSHDSILLQLNSSYNAYTGTAGSASAEAVKERPLEDLFADLYAEQMGGTPPEDEEYELMKYTAEIVRRRDPHEPVTAAEARRIIAQAGKTGGSEK